MKGLPIIGGWLAGPAANLFDIEPQSVEAGFALGASDRPDATLQDHLQQMPHRDARALGAMGHCHPVGRQLDKRDAASPHGWSQFRLLNWMTRPHLDFDTALAGALADDRAAVLAAFLREVEPEVHG